MNPHSTAKRQYAAAVAKMAQPLRRPPGAVEPSPVQYGKPTALEPSPSLAKKAIIAHVNVGWGNAVYLRGEGGGLSWDIGTPMICQGEDRWVWHCPEDEAPRAFKFLRNDTDWAAGENEVVQPHTITVCQPRF